MARAVTVVMILGLMVGAIAAAGSTNGLAQDTGPQATIEAQGTTIAELRGTVQARGKKINAQRTQIAELKTQVADIQAQVPPTMTPTPELTGKEAFPYVSSPLELFTRPHNHIGEKWSFCGTVGFIQVASPGNELYPGDKIDYGFDTVVQIFIDGWDAQFMVGFDGDSTGIFEDSYVCAWGTLVDTSTGTNTFGGTILNPLFEAEYLELA